MPPQLASYSTTSSKATMGQVFKEGSTTILIEGLDAILMAIYRKEDPSKMEIKKSKEEEIERERKELRTV